MLNRHLQQGFDARTHLGGRLVRESHGQEAVRRYAFDIDQPRGPVDKHARLATAGAGYDQRGLGRCSDGLTLRVIEVFEDRCDVHLAL